MEELLVFSEKIKYSNKEIKKELRLLNSKNPFTDTDAKKVKKLTVELEDQINEIRKELTLLNLILSEKDYDVRGILPVP